MYKICAPLGYYAALSGSYVPTFRDNLPVPFSSVKKSKNYRSALRNIPERRRFLIHGGGSLKSR
jgi:hypothetical protein